MTVRRRDLFRSPEFNEDRETETKADAEVDARVCLVDLVVMLASGSGVSSCVFRDRRDRRRDMVAAGSSVTEVLGKRKMQKPEQ